MATQAFMEATAKASQSPSATLGVPAARAAPIVSAGSLEAPIASWGAQLWHLSQHHLAHTEYSYGAI